MNNFYVGQKVVCVNDSGIDVDYQCGLTEGEIYTVRWIGFHSWSPDDPEALCILLNEIVRDRNPDEPEEVGYRADRFRPLVSTDISIFTAMLEQRKVPELNPC